MGVVLVAGPSGSGKSHLGRKLGWAVLRLDDFYRNDETPDLPRSSLGIVDWDHPGSWDAEAAIAAICQLSEFGTAQVPTYDISTSSRIGTQTLLTTGRFIAEGLFAPDIIHACRDAGVLEDAICLRRPRLVTFGLRLVRDLRESRKPPLTLVRRGWRLLREEPRIISRAVAAGCRPLSPSRAYAELSGLEPTQASAA